MARKRRKFFIQSVAVAAMMIVVAEHDALAATTSGAFVHVSQAEQSVPFIGEFSNYNELMDVVMDEMRQFRSEVTFKYTGSLNNFNASFDGALQEALMKPGNDYIHGTLSTWRYTYSSAGDVTLTLTYVGTIEQEQFVTKRVKEIASELTIDPNMTDFDKVKAVNDYIVTNVAYSRDTTTTPHHMYALLTEQKAVCQAYALLAYRLFEEMGIESRYVVGYAGGELHAWNTVQLNGVSYQLDTTWNDLFYNGRDLGDNIQYNYFLVTNEQLRRDHTWDEARYPVATDTRYAMYHDIAMGIEHDDDVYYSSTHDRFLYKMNKQTGVKERLTTVRAAHIAAHGDTIYFANESNNGFLSAYNVNTKQLTTVDAVPVTNVRVRGDELQYDANGTMKTTKLAQPALRQTFQTVVERSEAERVVAQINALHGAKVEDVIAVREAYDALSYEERLNVMNVKKLLVVERKMRRAIVAANRIEAIDPQSAKFTQQVAMARLALDRVPATQRKLMTSVRVLEQFEARM
ncbi:transglutaminase domain-containing protein [Caryophanon latum]|uniref:transglutaminase domain-containing protein n=1 Tax=Caryophanon latum TaxID=33977 RepID=UPI0011123D40|nr:transglutaminase domain-containing protein [Caryophanon latum]